MKLFRKMILAAAMSLSILTLTSGSAWAYTQLEEQSEVTNVDEIVRQVRIQYDDIQENPAYEWVGNHKVLKKTESDGSVSMDVLEAVLTTGDPLLDSLMYITGYQTYDIEFYYAPGDTGLAEKSPIFIYAVIDHVPYRYYFSENNLIRRISATGSREDNIETNRFLDCLYQIATFYSVLPENFPAGNSFHNGTLLFYDHFYDDIEGRKLYLYSYGGAGTPAGFYIIDQDTLLDDSLKGEALYRDGDTGYFFMSRYLSADFDLGYQPWLECFTADVTNGQVNRVNGVFATH